MSSLPTRPWALALLITAGCRPAPAAKEGPAPVRAQDLCPSPGIVAHPSPEEPPDSVFEAACEVRILRDGALVSTTTRELHPESGLVVDQSDGPTPTTTRRYYDEAERLLRSEQDDGSNGQTDHVQVLVWDEDGAWSRRDSFNVAGELSSRTHYRYDAEGRVILDWDESAASKVSPREQTHHYDEEGCRVRRTTGQHIIMSRCDDMGREVVRVHTAAASVGRTRTIYGELGPRHILREKVDTSTFTGSLEPNGDTRPGAEATTQARLELALAGGGDAQLQQCSTYSYDSRGRLSLVEYRDSRPGQGAGRIEYSYDCD